MTPSWAEWQAVLVELIADPEREASPALGVAPGGLAVYRNNYRTGLIGALVNTYPMLLRIVGEDYLTGLAREHVKGEPLRSGNVHHYGARFGDFIEGFEPARALPYLADMARVEWAAHRAYYAEDAEPLSPEAVEAEAKAARALRLDPSVSLVRSPWPVVTIWHAVQPGAPEDFYIDLGQGGEAALVHRRAGGILLEAVPAGHAVLLERLLAGDALEAAVTAACVADAVLDPRTARVWLCDRGLLVQGA